MPDKTNRELVGDTEPWFKQRVVELMNNIIRKRNLAFARAETEQSVRVGRKKHMYFDGVLWKRSGQEAVCEMEFKRPHIEAADFDLVNNAAQKANAIGAPFFLTWNVRDLWLWRTFQQNVPLLERDCKQWNGIVDVDDVNDLRESHWEKIETFLVELLDELNGLYNRQKQFVGLPVDEIFVRKLTSVVNGNYRVYAALINKKCSANRNYYKELRQWTAEHGWTTLLPADFAKTDNGAFDVLGRLAVFLLMNRVIFYKLVRTQHRTLDAMSFADVRTGLEFEQKLRGYFEAVLRINFATIFDNDVFDELRVPDSSVARLERFVADLDKYDFQTLSFDILGRVYEALIPERERHQLGQYFTPPITVDLINAFCIQRPEDIVLDPACGAGTFLVRAHERLNRLRARPHRSLLEQLWGFEIARYPAHIATINLVLPDLRERENFPYVVGTNAFTVKPDAAEFKVPAHQELRYQTRTLLDTTEVMVKVPMFDAVVGNPPYIERRNLKPADKEAIVGTIKSDWALHQFTKAADVFVYFFVHAGRFLKEGGRLGFVTSNGWLDHKYGVDLQRFFLDNFKVVSVIESGVERSFSQAEVNTAITIVERCSDLAARDENVIRFVSLRRPLANLIGNDGIRGSERFVKQLMDVNERTETEDWFVNPVKQLEAHEAGLDEDRKWTGGRWGAIYLRAPDIYFVALERGREILTVLRQLADGVLGTKTGCDEFFVRSPKDLADLGLEERFTRPAFWSPSRVRGFLLKPEDAPDRLVLISESKWQLKGTNASKYIDWAERKKLHTKGENERRANSMGRWYDLSQSVQAGRIAFSKTYNERHAVYSNPGGCVLGARFASFTPHDDVDEEVLLAVLNSSMTALFVEILGRTSLGLGALDFAVYEARSVPVVDPRKLDARTVERLKAAYRNLAHREPYPVNEEVASPDKQALDAIVFDVLGLLPAERKEVIASLLEKTMGRLKKARSVQSHAKVWVRSVTDDDVIEYGLAEIRAGVGLRRFPDDFLVGSIQEIIVPAADGLEGIPKVEPMMGQGTLVWPDGSHVEFQNLEAAQVAAMLLALGWSATLSVPRERTDAQRLFSELDSYVSLCRTRFEETLQEVAENDAQAKRVRQLFLPALGRMMFNGRS